METALVTNVCPRVHADNGKWQAPFQRLAVIVDCTALAEICGGRSPLEDDGYEAPFRLTVGIFTKMLMSHYLPRMDGSGWVEWS